MHIPILFLWADLMQRNYPNDEHSSSNPESDPEKGKQSPDVVIHTDATTHVTDVAGGVEADRSSGMPPVEHVGDEEKVAPQVVRVTSFRNISKTQLNTITQDVLQIISTASTLDDMHQAIIMWAQAALSYQGSKKKSTLKRVFSKGSVSAQTDLVNDLLYVILDHEGYLLGGPVISELQKHVNSSGTVTDHLWQIIEVYKTKSEQLKSGVLTHDSELSSGKKLGYVPDIDELKAGDILLFRTPFPELDPPGDVLGKITRKGIQMTGALLNYKAGGHYDTTHAGICVGHDKDGHALMAHLTGHDVMGYKKEPLMDMLIRDGGDRAFAIFRPQSEMMCDRITRIATQPGSEKIKWSRAEAAKMFIKFPSLTPDREKKPEKELDEASFCSKFVVQVIKNASREGDEEKKQEFTQYDVDILSGASTPKHVEGELYHNPNYEVLIYTGRVSILQLMVCKINEELERINSTVKEGTDGFEKLRLCNKKFILANELLAGITNYNDLDRALMLLKIMLPLLNINTGMGLTNSTAYSNLVSYARERGIYLPKDTDNIQVPSAILAQIHESEKLNEFEALISDIGRLMSQLSGALLKIQAEEKDESTLKIHILAALKNAAMQNDAVTAKYPGATGGKLQGLLNKYMPIYTAAAAQQHSVTSGVTVPKKGGRA
jgi:hypothetical protein